MTEREELWRKTGQRGLLITSYKWLEKDSDRATTPTAQAVPVPAHLALPGSPQAKKVCHLHAQLSLGQSCHRQKKVLHLGAQGRFSHVQHFVTLSTVACQASLSGGSPGKNTGVYWPILVAIPFKSTIFSASLAANSPEYLVLPEPL